MDTVKLFFPCSAQQSEGLVAALYDLGFDGFEEVPEGLKAYIGADRYSEALHRQVVRAAAHCRVEEGSIGHERIAAQNWNAVWEAGVRAVEAGRFLVRPGWVEPIASQRHLESILIEPKMSFGTGHHETTRLMLGLMPGVIRGGSLVLDAGTGTGVLAIASVRLGAGRAIAFDIDPWSEINAKENVDRNGMTGRVEVRLGDIGVVEERGFDVILANIQLNELVEYLAAFELRLSQSGCLLLSGLLLADREKMMEAAGRAGFVPEQEAEEGVWWAAVFKRASGVS